MEIIIKSPCSASTIIKYGIKKWPLWESGPSKFPWHYDEKEICLIIEGEATIKTSNGRIFNIQSGDLVEFREGVVCEWEISKTIKKHYRLGN